MNPMTNIHNWTSGQACTLLPMSCEALAGRNSPFRAKISCFYDACSKALLGFACQIANFLYKFKLLMTFASPVSFLETLWGREDLAHPLDALDTGISVFHRLNSLHYTAQHTVSSRNTQENSNIKFNPFSAAKKTTFLLNSTHLTSFIQQWSHQHRHRGAALEDDWGERQQQEEKL